MISLFNLQTFVTALLVAQSLALPSSASKRDEKNICNDGKLAAENPRAAFFRKILGDSEYTNHSKVQTPKDVPLKVGILGAGVAGLYAAILLDSIGIDYEIHEASERIGGRIYTYHFDQEAWDKSTPEDPAYYDYYVGPENRHVTQMKYTKTITGRWGDAIPSHAVYGPGYWK